LTGNFSVVINGWIEITQGQELTLCSGSEDSTGQLFLPDQDSVIPIVANDGDDCGTATFTSSLRRQMIKKQSHYSLFSADIGRQRRLDHHLESLPEGVVNNATFIIQPPNDMAGEYIGDSGLVGPLPLNVCTPLCSIDDDCNGTMACFQRNAYEFIPGCSDCANSTDQSVDCRGAEAIDYCWDIENEGGANWTVSTVKSKDGEPDNGPLGACQGYCRDDDDCAVGLACDGFPSGEVPGCIGGKVYSNSYTTSLLLIRSPVVRFSFLS